MTDPTFINQRELAQRWGISPHTLERWRWLGVGVRYLKLGGRVVYRMDDITTFEAERLYANTSQNQPLIPDYRNERIVSVPLKEGAR